jgi:hypothetical protein
MGQTLMLTRAAPVSASIGCLGVATPGCQVPRTASARGSVPGAGTNDPRNGERLSLPNTTQDVGQPKECGFSFTHMRWMANNLRLESRAMRGGLPGSARFVAAVESAIDGE